MKDILIKIIIYPITALVFVYWALLIYFLIDGVIERFM